jgi:hypothetical protein
MVLAVSSGTYGIFVCYLGDFSVIVLSSLVLCVYLLFHGFSRVEWYVGHICLLFG